VEAACAGAFGSSSIVRRGRSSSATSDSAWFEIPAGILEGDPVLRPDKHIFVEIKSPWFEIEDDLPRLDKIALIRLRQGG
jgi:hypothetical protein